MQSWPSRCVIAAGAPGSERTGPWQVDWFVRPAAWRQEADQPDSQATLATEAEEVNAGSGCCC